MPSKYHWTVLTVLNVNTKEKKFQTPVPWVFKTVRRIIIQTNIEEEKLRALVAHTQFQALTWHLQKKEHWATQMC